MNKRQEIQERIDPNPFSEGGGAIFQQQPHA
jgi:hypothetical protein